MAETLHISELRDRVGQEVGVSRWIEVTQDVIDGFAEVTQDRQFIHVDPARAAAETPFGGTIAHGFLTLSLLSACAYDALPQIEGRAMGINYGFDKIRFLSPVRSGSRVRARFRLAEVQMRSRTEALIRYGVMVEIEGAQRPALAADWLTMAVLAPGHDG
ncbi:MAG TPA: MaoC family dehydratase [Beijerinckiaceae bacterium]|nr:MaoC family dehydratase [Beijerinckiaceae bacterium]